MRVATIDIGTNTTLLLVAERDANGEIRAVREEATITRLGEGVDVARRLAPRAIERTSECLAQYAAIVRELGAAKVAVVGTSAMRDAGGGEEIRARVMELFGVEARTISGDEEARVTFAGALSGMHHPSGDAVVFDIGGGSTEIVVGTVDDLGRAREVRAEHSFDVGSVRLTERHVRSDPPTSDELETMRGALRDAFSREPELIALARRVSAPPVGIAGTVTTIAAVALALSPYDGARVHGHAMTRAEIEAVTTRLASLPLDERRKVKGLEPKRADVIVAGCLVTLAVLDAFGADRLRVSDRGVRWGLAESLFG